MKLVYFVLILFFPAYLAGQDLNQFIFSSQGDFSVGKDISFSWSIGEPVIETGSIDNLIFTQGFQQPKIIIQDIDLDPSVEWDALIYPNPTNQSVTLEIANGSQEYLISLYDISGKRLWSKKESSNILKIDLSDLPNGEYILNLSQALKLRAKSFQILKSN